MFFRNSGGLNLCRIKAAKQSLKLSGRSSKRADGLVSCERITGKEFKNKDVKELLKDQRITL